MLSVLFFMVWGCNFFCCLTKKKIKVIEFISIIFLIVLFCGNTSNGDYWNYIWRYDANQLEEFELGFQIVAKICRSMGLHYNVFMSILVIPSYYLIFRTLKKYTDSISTFITLYFAVLVFYDINQLRNFVVSALLTYAIAKLSDGKKYTYIFLISLATLFHTIAAIYFCFVFLPIPKKLFKTYRIAFFISLSFCIIILINGKKIPFLDEIFQGLVGENSKKMGYIQTKINFGFLIPWGCQVMNMLLVATSVYYLKKNNNYQSNKKFIQICYLINFLGVCVMPLVMIDLSFDRIFRNFSFIFYILAGMTIESFNLKSNNNWKTISKTKLTYVLMLVIYSMVWMIGTVMHYGMGFSQWDLILHNNLFFAK